MLKFGSGPPLVMIPGLEGQWSWMRPAIDALSPTFTVITFPLCGERGSGRRFGEADGFEVQLAAVDDALREAGAARAAICGLSYGGWIALAYAARYPERVTALVLASSPPPGFQPNARQMRYLASPIRSAVPFIVTAPGRVAPEVIAALPTWRARVRFALGHTARVMRTRISPTRMARRMRVAERVDFFEACRCVAAPTLIVTGEAGLDRVVPVEETRKYVSLIPGAELVTLPGTGHLGTLTRPDEFARVVSEFVARSRSEAQDTRLPRVG